MFRRMAMGGALACLIATALVPTQAEAASKTQFKGKTAQDRAIKIRGGQNTLQIIRFNIELSCGDGSELIIEESGFLRTPVRANGSFRDTQFGKTDTVTFRGKVKGKTIRGSIRVKDKTAKMSCKSRWVKFTAQR